MTTPLPPIDSSLVPADVRKDGAQGVQAYQAALSFESLLTQQLAQQLTAAVSDSSDDSDSSGDGTTQIMQQMLPDAFAQGVANAGGLGLADQLYKALKQS
jgi:Rod binding domain-containing protein